MIPVRPGAAARLARQVALVPVIPLQAMLPVESSTSLTRDARVKRLFDRDWSKFRAIAGAITRFTAIELAQQAVKPISRFGPPLDCPGSDEPPLSGRVGGAGDKQFPPGVVAIGVSIGVKALHEGTVRFGNVDAGRIGNPTLNRCREIQVEGPRRDLVWPNGLIGGSDGEHTDNDEALHLWESLNS